MAGAVLGLVSNQAKFYISAICGLVGFIITIIFVPGVSLLLACFLFCAVFRRLEHACACVANQAHGKPSFVVMSTFPFVHASGRLLACHPANPPP